VDRPRRPRRAERAGRAIGPEDRALWDKVNRDTTPLTPVRNTADSAPNPDPAKPPAKPSLNHPPRSLVPAESGKPQAISMDLAERAVTQVGRAEPGLDRRNAERLRRGERAPDGRIDLHGMNTGRAHRALDRRIAEALARGERLVLVITGKGGKRRHEEDAPFMRENTGVLRQQAPRWLRAGPYANQIVGIYQAHPRHGGTGAFYVYLKKPR